MGASVKAGGGGGRRRRGGRSKHAPMSEINVTPMVDVMLVLLIIFMVAAPLLTVGVPIELPKAHGKQLEAKQEPLVISVKPNGEAFIADALVPLEELATKLKSLAETRKGDDEPIFVRGDKDAKYEMVMKVMSRISKGGFHKVSLITEVEEGG